ncbi:hypothetical protein NC652_009986 [Populus alba x Populus x berolinensis]|nr:hypothetical protein NC652_009986 [Populus alba x Populus x berolinensis]
MLLAWRYQTAVKLLPLSVQNQQGLVKQMDWGFVHKAWEKWTSINVGSSNGEPLKAALLINYDPNAPSRLLSIMNKLHSENFTIGQNQYPELGGQMWLHPFMRIVFCARSMTTSKPAGEGAIIMQTSAFLLVALYDGSIGAASRAMVAVDQFAWQLGRRNLCYLCLAGYVDSKFVTEIIVTQFP